MSETNKVYLNPKYEYKIQFNPKQNYYRVLVTKYYITWLGKLLGIYSYYNGKKCSVYTCPDGHRWFGTMSLAKSAILDAKQRDAIMNTVNEWSDCE